MRRTTLGTLMTKPLAVWGRAGVDSDKKISGRQNYSEDS